MTASLTARPPVRHPAVAAREARRNAARHSPSTYVLLFGTVGVLALVGVVMVLSASSVVALHREGSSWFYFTRQLIGLCLGAALFLATLRVDYRRWRRLAPLAHGAVLVLLLAVLVPGFGVNVNGSSRWVDLGFMQLQPSELAKLTTLLVVADLAARRQAWVHHESRVLRPALVIVAKAPEGGAQGGTP